MTHWELQNYQGCHSWVVAKGVLYCQQDEKNTENCYVYFWKILMNAKVYYSSDLKWIYLVVTCLKFIERNNFNPIEMKSSTLSHVKLYISRSFTDLGWNTGCGDYLRLCVDGFRYFKKQYEQTGWSVLWDVSRVFCVYD